MKLNANLKGFTLIEVMITVAIIAIVTSIAYPSYTQYVLSSKRSAAITNVMDVATRQNQYFSNNKTYANALADLGLPATYYVSSNRNTTSANALYQITVTNITSTAFEVNAVPQNEMASSDSECGTFTVDETGEKTVSGSGDSCW